MSTKKRVLEILENSRGESLSGQEIAEGLDLSRTAIWKAINTLREEGHQIESLPKTGYTLLEKSDVLNTESIQRLLDKSNPEMMIHTYSTIGSTNNEAKKILNQNIKQDTLILSEEQTEGKGRLGRVFVSPASTGLYMSLILHEVPSEKNPTLITTVAAVAVCRAIEKLTSKKPQIKWVNDLFVDGKKICGILTEGIINMETQTIGSIILGIGINMTVSKKSIPNNLQKIIGGLFDSQIDDQKVTRNQVAAEIMNEFYPLYHEMESKEYLDQYRERCFVLGQNIFFKRNNEELEGKAISIDDEGGLVVEIEDGESFTLSYGEISIKIKDTGEN